MISCKLSLKFDKIAAREQTQDEEGIPSPQARKSPRAALLPELEPEKPKRKFEDIIFEEDFANAATTERTENDIFDTSVNVKDSREIMSKIKNLRFEVTSEMDMQPIIKKLKGPDTKVNLATKEKLVYIMVLFSKRENPSLFTLFLG